MKTLLRNLPALAVACFSLQETGAHHLAQAASLPTFEPAVPLVSGGPISFAPLVRKVVPAVVNISVTRDSDTSAKHKLPSTVKGTPLEKRYRERMRRHRDELLGAGSGFIVDPEGTIVTNGHVVEDADKITVALASGKEFTATLAGIDNLTDIAVIKISSPQPLPYVTWGDSRLVQVGDWIMAAGNPFGLGSSVTAGIVSARGRDIGTSPFDDFLQLDAPINPGNSGGPTFNLAGQVVALNTAIVSPTGGSVGLGFSIPSEIVIPIVETLRQAGHIERGWLGATLEDIMTHNGTQVTEVDRNGPAAKGGLKKGDIIVGMNNEHVETARAMIRAVASAKPGLDAQLNVLRNNQPITLTIRIGRRPKWEDGNGGK
ncbi:endopeptidase DegP/Do [Acetobacter senegalensis DSM 18889]|uniref:Probable periplasmic serine endoprotease DegP-like n=1 Tax=Acetobacter pasteurianus subsp. pasteurianus TaxID=481145 RepID=A0A1Y0Y3Q5_ACEPA|nr:trypsin-like peptidase domain-containing protein [Acetobacter pasteurianus]AKR48809.1 endopeptidase [Acetobacter pasteurianus]ARW46836.1 Peptidase Do [Acetobacter pasteurianus subsp. pasteurianus]NLG90828.1 PDZ domain-containing protein [Acetobacter sp.]GBR58840.1 endopeptidase DegP/Do [Acetobacter senegalensis DSM 18889]